MIPPFEMYAGIGFVTVGFLYMVVMNAVGGGDDGVEVSSNAVKIGPGFSMMGVGIVLGAAYLSGIDLLSIFGL